MEHSNEVYVETEDQGEVPPVDPCAAKLWLCSVKRGGCGKFIGYIVRVSGVSMLKIVRENGDIDTVYYDDHICGACGHRTVFYQDAKIKALEMRYRAMERRMNPKRGGTE